MLEHLVESLVVFLFILAEDMYVVKGLHMEFGASFSQCVLIIEIPNGSLLKAMRKYVKRIF